MAKRMSKETKVGLQELVVATITEDIEEAKNYEILLKSSDIPTMIREQHEQENDSQMFAVMVPEDFLDEALVVIESQDAYDDFYDFSSEDNDDDFGSESLDDCF